jgi:hypothetical protein
MGSGLCTVGCGLWAWGYVSAQGSCSLVAWSPDNRPVTSWGIYDDVARAAALHRDQVLHCLARNCSICTPLALALALALSLSLATDSVFMDDVEVCARLQYSTSLKVRY